MNVLMSRNTFRESVFERDGHLCVVCGKTGQDAHHIMERRLFPDGGYYLGNGATLCGNCHIEAEQTKIEVETLVDIIGEKRVLLPPHLYRDQRYDKWGNPILPNGTRLKGELFFDESVQKIIKPYLHLFTDYVKYPRSHHLLWSPGYTDDDRFISQETLDSWDGKEVVITEKMDGENTTLYHDYLHARSIDYSSHPSRDKIKALWAAMAHNIPKGWRICGENLTAVHSIKYTNLESIFQVFSIWDERNVCLNWEDTCIYTNALNLVTVPVIWKGTWNKNIENNLRESTPDKFSINLIRKNTDEIEGYVVRLASEFSYRDFSKSLGKYVRANHVQTHGHWMRNKLEFNSLKK